MKKFEMTKKGCATVCFIMDDDGGYSMSIYGTITPLADEAMVRTQVASFKAAGFSYKTPATNKESTKISKPKPKKQYPEGFAWDPELYHQVAKDMGVLICVGGGRFPKFKVAAKNRDAVYAEMAKRQQASK